MAGGNLIVAASILFTGNTYWRIKEASSENRVYESCDVQQNLKLLLFPAIRKVYLSQRQAIIDKYKDTDLHVIGDGRCDSPGYNAKYGTYTIMEAYNSEIIDFHVAHVRLAGNSARMEKDGLLKLLDRFDDFPLKITSITTDRHIKKRILKITVPK